jgi:hypothetical protein
MQDLKSKNEPWLVTTDVFKHPFTCLLAGPTQSGKSFFIKDILKNCAELINPPPEKIIYCYSIWQPLYDELQSTFAEILSFNKGIISIEGLNEKENKLIILDDLMKKCEKDPNILDLFTVDSHHKNISVMFVSQNLFSQGKYFRTISLNSQYLVLFKNPRDKSQIVVLARQMFPEDSRFLVEAFKDAVENQSHSYLFVDLKQSTLEKNRIQAGIVPGQERIIYTPK